MTRHIDIILTCPPAADFPSLVEVVDSAGTKLAAGQWIEPSANDPFWRFRLQVAELVVMLVAPEQEPQITEATARYVRRNPPLVDRGAVTLAHSSGQSAREALRAKVALAKPRSARPQAAPMVSPKQCPSCLQMFDEAIHELADCVQCGESKCTARCITYPLNPCTDCEALAPDPGEGFDPNAVPDDAPGMAAALALDRKEGRGNAAAAHLFDGKMIGKPGAVQADDEGEDE